MATRTRVPAATDLHDEDFHVRAGRQADPLRARRFDEPDLTDPIGEIEGPGDAKRCAVLSNARVGIEHLLRLQHGPATGPRNGWRATVRGHGRRLQTGMR